MEFEKNENIIQGFSEGRREFYIQILEKGYNCISLNINGVKEKSEFCYIPEQVLKWAEKFCLYISDEEYEKLERLL